MESLLRISAMARKGILKIIDGFTVDQLNKIPEGFNNNIAWNIGHLIVTEQQMLYKMLGLEMNISEEMFLKYKNGSKPEAFISAEEIEQMKGQFLSILQDTEKDYKAGKFDFFKGTTMGSGMKIHAVEDAMAFNGFHEGMHYGIIMNLKKLV